MAEITRERRAFLAECIDGEPDSRSLSGWGIAVSIADIRALLDAADERDRLREERGMKPRDLAVVIFDALKQSGGVTAYMGCSPDEHWRTTLDGDFNLRSVARRVLSALHLGFR
jgi:hypothetical protein